MFDVKDTLLPPTATPLAKALDILEERLFSLPVQMISKVPATVEVGWLDHLAWENSVDTWDSDWPEDIKRSVIAVSAEVRRFKGTPYAIRTALAAFDVGTELLEWFEPEGVADGLEAGSFRVTAYADKSLFGLDESVVALRMVYAMNAVIQRVAPVSRKLHFRLGERFGSLVSVRNAAMPALASNDRFEILPRPEEFVAEGFLRHAMTLVAHESVLHMVRRRESLTAFLWGRIGYGQSTMGPSGQEGNGIIAGAYFPDHCLQPNAPRAYGTEQTVGDGVATVDPDAIASLVPAEDVPGYGENFPMTLTAWAVEHIWRSLEGMPTPGQVSATCWEGGANIHMFQPGTSNFANVGAFLRKWDSLAGTRDQLADAPVLHWTQGEGGGVTYEDDLRSLFAALDGEWIIHGFPEPRKIALQVNLSDDTTRDRESRPAIVKLAREGLCVLAGPMYVAPLADNIHPGQFGDVVLASMSALAEYRLRKGLDTDPLWITGGDVRGSRLRLKYHLPTHCAAVEVNTSFLPAIKDAGFVCRDNLGALEISSVVASASDEVTLTFAREVFGPVEVEYAVLTMDASPSGWANGIGNIMCVSTVPALFAGETYSGRVVPDFVLQPAVAETVTIGGD